MTSKEKAKELIDKYKNYALSTGVDENNLSFNDLKQCALIAVDEIIQLLVDLSKGYYTFSNNLKYYEEVKEEINKL